MSKRQPSSPPDSLPELLLQLVARERQVVERRVARNRLIRPVNRPPDSTAPQSSASGEYDAVLMLSGLAKLL